MEKEKDISNRFLTMFDLNKTDKRKFVDSIRQENELIEEDG